MKTFKDGDGKAYEDHIFVLTKNPSLYKLNRSPRKKLFFPNYDIITFPGGERHIKIKSDIPLNANILIDARFTCSDDIIDMALLSDAVDVFEPNKKSLFLPKIPGARQDRRCVVGEALSAKVYANIINACRFDRVDVLTPHSDVSPALIDNCQILDDLRLIWPSFEFTKNEQVNIISPDAGAMKRTMDIAKRINYSRPDVAVSVYTANKARDLNTGEIVKFELNADDLRGHRTIVFDDINCKGGTFIGLACLLDEMNVGHRTLFTTHSDCQSGVDNVAANYDQIITSDSNPNIATSSSNITLVKCTEALNFENYC